MSEQLPDNLQALKSLRSELTQTLSDLDEKIQALDYDNQVQKLNEDIPELLCQWCRNRLAADEPVDIEFVTDHEYYGWIGLQVNNTGPEFFGSSGPWKSIEDRMEACWSKYDSKKHFNKAMPPRLVRGEDSSYFYATANQSIVGQWISMLPSEIQIKGATGTIATLEEELANLSTEIDGKQRHIWQTEAALQLLDSIQEKMEENDDA